VKPNTAQLVRGALQRSAWLLVILVAGVATFNWQRQQDGPLYTASASVILSPTDLAAAVAGSGYVDPDRVDDTEGALAESPELYEWASRRAGGALGSGSELRSATSVTPTAVRA